MDLTVKRYKPCDPSQTLIAVEFVDNGITIHILSSTLLEEWLPYLLSSAAQMGDTTAPAPEEENHQHFLAFVKGKDGHLWEMDGGWKGPLDRGELGIDDDALSEKALQVGVRRFLAQTAGELQFSIVALAPGLD